MGFVNYDKRYDRFSDMSVRSCPESFVFVWFSHPPMSPASTQANTLCPLEAHGLYKYVSHFGGHHALNEFQVEIFDVSSVFTKKT